MNLQPQSVAPWMHELLPRVAPPVVLGNLTVGLCDECRHIAPGQWHTYCTFYGNRATGEPPEWDDAFLCWQCVEENAAMVAHYDRLADEAYIHDELEREGLL